MNENEILPSRLVWWASPEGCRLFSMSIDRLSLFGHRGGRHGTPSTFRFKQKEISTIKLNTRRTFPGCSLRLTSIFILQAVVIEKFDAVQLIN